MIDIADSNSVYYYHFDGLGSVAALSDVNGGVVERYSYDVFGEPIYKPEFEKAKKWTEEMEKKWDKYNKEKDKDNGKKGSET